MMIRLWLIARCALACVNLTLPLYFTKYLLSLLQQVEELGSKFSLIFLSLTVFRRDANGMSRSNEQSDISGSDALIDSPLTVILLELIERSDSRLPEQLFLSHLLSHSQTRGNSLPVPGQIANSPASTLWKALESALRGGAAVPKLNTSSLCRMWTERHPEVQDKYFRLPSVSAVVPDPEPNATTMTVTSLANELGEDVALLDFVPSFVRPPPPFVPIDTDSSELRWIDPEPYHEIVWDPQMCGEGARAGDIQELMATALRSPLKEEQQQVVKTQLEADPKLVFQCGVTPQNLPDLVQNNSVIATEVLTRLLNSNQREVYFSALVNMDMNQHSMAVVNRLTSTIQLPSEFVRTYVSNCIRSCGNIPDKYGQIRMVRFVCVFLQTLIKNNHIDLQDLFIEVQAFCMEHSRYVAPCKIELSTLWLVQHELARAVRKLTCLDIVRPIF